MKIMSKIKVHAAPTSGPRLWLWQVIAGSGLTKKAFAERVGINETALNNMYNGHRGIGDNSIYRIVRAMKVDPPPGYAKPIGIGRERELEDLKLENLRLQVLVQELNMKLRRKDEDSEIVSQPRRTNKR